jgi:hypothetical protein
LKLLLFTATAFKLETTIKWSPEAPLAAVQADLAVAQRAVIAVGDALVEAAVIVVVIAVAVVHVLLSPDHHRQDPNVCTLVY